MCSNFVTWNVRGVVAEDKLRALRRVVRKHKPLIVTVQETKKEFLSEKLINFMWGKGDKGWIELPSKGLSRGVVVLWDASRLELLDYHIGAYTITLLCKCFDTGEVWAFTGLYGPTKQSEKALFWEELDTTGRLWDCPWLIAGDFNVVRQKSERSSGRISKSERVHFQSFIDEFGLLEFDRMGPSFTFSNGQSIPSRSRLDRFLANAKWFETFRDHTENVRGFYKSDHRLLLLQDSAVGFGPKPFRFEKFWLEREDLIPLLRQWWEADHTQGRPGYVLFKKLKNLKSNIKSWAKANFGRFEQIGRAHV